MAQSSITGYFPLKRKPGVIRRDAKKEGISEVSRPRVLPSTHKLLSKQPTVTTATSRQRGKRKRTGGGGNVKSVGIQDIATLLQVTYQHANKTSEGVEEVKPTGEDGGKEQTSPSKSRADHGKGLITPSKSRADHGKGLITHSKSRADHGKGLITPSKSRADHGKGLITPSKSRADYGKGKSTPIYGFFS